MSWKCVCMCEMHGCCMGGEAFSSLLYIQITANQGFVSHISCCFCCHQRQKKVPDIVLCAQEFTKHTSSFPLVPPLFCLCLILFLDTFFPFLMAKTEQRNKKTTEYLIQLRLCATLYFLFFSPPSCSGFSLRFHYSADYPHQRKTNRLHPDVRTQEFKRLGGCTLQDSEQIYPHFQKHK